MKYLCILILGFVSGYFLSQSVNNRPIEVKLPAEKTTKLQNFIDQEVKAFAQLQDAEAKLKAAEAMYGRMMILFLADLGLKSSHQFQPAVKPVLPEINEVVLAEKLAEKIAVDETTVTATNPKDTAAKDKKTANEKIFDQYRSAYFVESFEGTAKKLLGTFKGNLNHRTPRNQGRVDTVFMNFNLVQTGKIITGDTLVTMTDQHNVEYSRNAGNGGNRAIRSMPSDAESFFVEASPTSYFFINLKDFPQVTGQYYEREKLIGNIRLHKVDGP